MGAGLFLITSVAFLRAPLLPDIGRDLSLSAVGLGALGSVFALGRLAADLPAGRMTDRARPGSMMAGAAAIVAAGSMAMGLAPNSIVAFIAAFWLGVGSTWTMTTTMAFFAGAPRTSRGTSMSFFAGALLGGQAIGPAAGGILAGLSDWRPALVIGGMAAALLVAPFVRFRGATPRTRREEARPDRPLPVPRRRVLVVIYLLPAVQFSVGAAVVQTLAPIAGGAELGLGPATVGLALGLGGLARLLGALVSGRVADLVGRRWALLPGLAVQILGLGLFAFGAGAVAWWLAILFLTLGSVAVSVGGTILADLVDHRVLGKHLGVFRFTGDSAFLVAPLLVGVLYETSGRALATLPLLLLTAAVTLSAALLLPETRSRPGH